MLAELKMHLRDEHIRSGRVKDQIRKNFENINAANQTQISSTQNINSAQPNNSIEQENITHHENTTMDSNSRVTSSNSIHDIVFQLIRMVNEDNDIPSNVCDSSGDPGFKKIPLSDLFAFEQNIWLVAHETAARVGLHTELELYEMVENSHVDDAHSGDAPVLDEGTDAVLCV